MPAKARKAADTFPAVRFTHGTRCLPKVRIESYNIEIRDKDGFIGDRASKAAFRAVIDKWRKPLADAGKDPFDGEPSEELGKSQLDKLLDSEDADIAALMHGIIEEFSQELTTVVRRLLADDAWKNVERIAVGGGMSGHLTGQRIIGRVSALLVAEGVKVPLAPIAHEPDDAGLIGVLQFLPEWMFRGHNAALAVDIGGTKLRAGLVGFDPVKEPGFANAAVLKREIWRHSEEKASRETMVGEMAGLLEKLIAFAEKKKRHLAPFVGIGCPGLVKPNGTIARGAQNLRGQWESEKFSLPERIAKAIPRIGDDETVVFLHNDAVTQGLSEVANMQDVSRWGILTLGTGLGNALFRNRESKT